MMVLSHALIGAVVGEELNNPIAALVVMVIVHLLMDKIVHFWPKTKKGERVFQVVDILSCGFVLLAILFFQPSNYVSVFAGAFGGILIDVIFVGIPYIKRSKYGVWQEKRQPHSGRKITLLSDFIAIFLGLIYWIK